MNPLFDDEEALMDALCVEAHKRCYPCSLKYRDDLEGMAHKNPSRQSIRIFGIEYHVDDFVYIKHREPMLAIGQLTDLLLNSHDRCVRLRRFERLSGIQARVRHPSDPVCDKLIFSLFGTLNP